MCDVFVLALGAHAAASAARLEAISGYVDRYVGCLGAFSWVSPPWSRHELQLQG